MKKVLLSFSQIGFGHASRCKAIVERMSDTFFVILSSSKTKVFFKGLKNVKFIPLESISMQFSFKLNVFDTFFSNLINLPKFISAYYELKRIVNKVNPNLIINDSEPLVSYYLTRNKQQNIQISNFPFTLEEYKYMKKEKWMKEEIKIIKKFLYGLYEESNLVISPSFYIKKKNKVLFIPPIVRKSKKKEKSYFIATFGGSKFGIEITKKIIPVIKKINKPFLITGVSMNNKVIGKKFVSNLNDFIRESKGVITLAGLSTLGEVYYYKKPALIIPIPFHIEQYANANFFKRKKIAIVKEIKDVDKENFEELFNLFFSLKDKVERKISKEKVENGVSEVIRKIKEFL